MNRTDDETFRSFVAARSQALLRTAYLLTGNIADAEDLLQTALFKTFRHWPRLHNKQSPDAFVRRVMVTTRTDWRRRRRVAEDSVADLPDHPSHDNPTRDGRDEMWLALGTLPPRMRAVLVLRYWEDLSESETAHLLGCSTGTVKSQASRGLARLRRQLEPVRIDSLVQLRREPS